jgi:hypothetical protein
LGSQAETNDNLPLIIAGDGRSRGHFRRYSQHAASVMGEISGIRTKDSVSTLGRLAQPHLMRRLQEEQAAAKAELDRADAHGLIDWGLQAAWAGVQDGSADRVWVEQSFARPGRPADDPTKVELLSDPTQPGINDDLVDDLIESATKKGIHVHLLAARTIGRPEPIAVRKRARVPTTETPLEVAQAV